MPLSVSLFPSKITSRRGSPRSVFRKGSDIAFYAMTSGIFTVLSVIPPIAGSKKHRTCYLRVERCTRRLLCGRARPRKSGRTHKKSSYRKEK